MGLYKVIVMKNGVAFALLGFTNTRAEAEHDVEVFNALRDADQHKEFEAVVQVVVA